jgi:hypothetical protein
MGSKLQPLDENLYRRADEVLHYIWDPIGISDDPQARDEYYAYLPVVFGLLKANAGAEAIAEHLQRIRTERMGLDGNDAQDFKAASVLVDWRSVIAEAEH